MGNVKIILILVAVALSLALYAGNAQIGVALAQQQVGLVAKYVEGRLPITEPGAEIWNRVAAQEIALGPQMTAAPWIHPEPAIRSISVRAINNGTWVSFLIEWRDESRDDEMRMATFRDAVAVMLSLEPGIGQCMGTPAASALIAHWKADWQRDIDKAFTDVADLYPNFWSDWYPMVAGSPPYKLSDIIADPRASSFVGGWAAGNPLSNPLRLSPVETLVAKGWGTLTTFEDQLFIGRGIHDGSKWRVVISRPVMTGSADPPWGDGEPVEVAFAVWNGAAGEIGAKKGVSLPMSLTIERPAAAAAPTPEGPTAPAASALPAELLSATIIAVAIAAVLIVLILTVERPRRKQQT